MTTSDTTLPGSLMRAEIDEQPAVFAQLLAHHAVGIRALNAEMAVGRFRFVLIAARGSSDHAALYAKYLVEVLLQVPAGLVSPSSFTVYAAQPDLTDVLFLAISQSGASPDLVDSLATARGGGAFTIAVTNDASSPLAQAADRHVDIAAGQEVSVAATKTYTAELLALYLLLAPQIGDLSALPAAAEATLRPRDRAARAAARYRTTRRIVTTGRGFGYPTAREAALKLMETCYVSAQAFSGADLLHGPLAMIDEAVPVIAVLSPGRAGEAMGPVLAAVREQNTDILTVGAGADLDVRGDGLPEAVLPMLEILPLQQLCLELALERGGDPDRPRGLNKVTRTW